MAKYHISPKTGRANACKARAKPCPLGSENDHYPTKEAAQQAYEKKMQAKTMAPTVSRKSPQGALPPHPNADFQKKVDAQLENPFVPQGSNRKEQLQIDSNILMQNMVTLAQEKKALLKDAEKNGFDKTLAEGQRIDKEMKNYQQLQADIDGELRAIAVAEEAAKKAEQDSMLKASMPAQYHSDKSRIKDVIDRYNSNPRKPSRATHYSLNAGRLNPLDKSGSGAQYFEPGNNSLVILAEADGKSPRAISSSGEAYKDPESELGAVAIQIKQGGDKDVQRGNLRVLGYVDTRGNRHGWIPNKQIAFFVYK